MHENGTDWHRSASPGHPRRGRWPALAAPLVLVALASCGSSHGPAEGLADGGRADANACPPIAGSCMDTCCQNSRPPTLAADCTRSCPDGYRFVDRCAPGPGCMECGPIDPGICQGGPCCDDEVVAELNYSTCSASCPDGYQPAGECTPDPAARCAAPWLSCGAKADCMLAANTCCGACGEVTLSDFDAINRSRQDEHRDYVCPGPPPPCPRCATLQNPSLGATCESGLCRGFDVRAADLSRCSDARDCRLRVTGCCACGGDTSPYSLIAIRQDAESDYQALVCDDADCDACEPVYPDGVEAFCADDGHCQVRVLGTS